MFIIYCSVAVGVPVPEGQLDQYPEGCNKNQPQRCGQGLVQHTRDQLGGLPDLQAQETHGNGQVQHAGMELYKV